MSVEVDRDQNLAPLEIRIKKGRKKLIIKEIYGTGTDTFGFTVEGRRGDLPSLTDVFKIVDAKRLDTIGKIELVNLIKEITEILSIKVIESIGSLPPITIIGSEGIALKQATAGAGAWTDPDGFSDPDNEWENEPNTYDNNTSTYAYTNTNALPAWTSFLYLTFSAAIRANLIKYYVDAATGYTKIDLDVKKDGGWIDVYEGDFIHETWTQKLFAEGSVDEIRIRFYNATGAPSNCQIREVDVWRVPLTGGELEIVDVTP